VRFSEGDNRHRKPEYVNESPADHTYLLQRSLWSSSDAASNYSSGEESLVAAEVEGSALAEAVLEYRSDDGVEVQTGLQAWISHKNSRLQLS
jgi:hypothetical protein